MEHETITVGGDVAITSQHRRGRPAKALPPRVRELRLTPIDRPDDPIEWFTRDGIVKIAAFEEGGYGTQKRLHYHAIVETTLSDDLLKSYCYQLTRGKGTEGNKAFMSREPHENVTGYIAKHKKPVHVIGYTDAELQSWYAKSDEYVAALKHEREKYRKIKALGRKRELLSVEQDISNELKDFPDGQRPIGLAGWIVGRFLEECSKRSYDFPTRTQMEGIVNRLRYSYDPVSVIAFYRRNLNVVDEYTQHYAQNGGW